MKKYRITFDVYGSKVSLEVSSDTMHGVEELAKAIKGEAKHGALSEAGVTIEEINPPPDRTNLHDLIF